jgi:hypothetical protein
LVGAPLPYSNWVHVAATFNSASGLFQLYTNGVLASSTNNATGTGGPLAGQFLRQTTLPLKLGGETLIEGPVFAAGYLDEVRIWNTNRTSIQIEESRFCRLTGTESNLTAYWNFDATNAIDLTGNGNNGTLDGGAVIVPINGQDVVHDGVCGAPYIDPASLSYSAVTGFRQKILGPSGMTLAVETSTNLADWSTLFILPNFTGEFDFDDVDDIGLPLRFYRAGRSFEEEFANRAPSQTLDQIMKGPVLHSALTAAIPFAAGQKLPDIRGPDPTGGNAHGPHEGGFAPQ